MRAGFVGMAGWSMMLVGARQVVVWGWTVVSHVPQASPAGPKARHGHVRSEQSRPPHLSSLSPITQMPLESRIDLIYFKGIYTGNAEGAAVNDSRCVFY